jgi:hypothetical protein
VITATPSPVAVTVPELDVTKATLVSLDVHDTSRVAPPCTTTVAVRAPSSPTKKRRSSWSIETDTTAGTAAISTVTTEVRYGSLGS